MTCIVLAAGYATRMYPLTLNFPKPLLEVGGKRIIDHLLDDVISIGTDRIIVVSNHKFISHFSSWAKERGNVEVVDDNSIDNDHRLGAVKDIEFAMETLKVDDDILVLAGDNLLDFSLKSFVEYAEKKGTSCIMRHSQEDKEKLRKTGVITINEDEMVTGMEEKPKEPKSNWAVPPFYFYKKEDALRIRRLPLDLSLVR